MTIDELIERLKRLRDTEGGFAGVLTMAVPLGRAGLVPTTWVRGREGYGDCPYPWRGGRVSGGNRVYDAHGWYTQCV